MGPPSWYQADSFEWPVAGSKPIPPPTPRRSRYQAFSTSGSFARKKYPPIPMTGMLASLSDLRTVADETARFVPAALLDPLHVGAECDEVVDEAGMRAADRVGVEDRRFALDRRGDHQQRDRHANDVRAGHRRGSQLAAAESDQPVRIAQQRVRTKQRQLGVPGQAALVDLVPEHRLALGLDPERDEDRQQVGRDVGPGGRLDLGDQVRSEVLLDLEPRRRFEPRPAVLVPYPRAELGECPVDQVEMLGMVVAHRD